MFEQFVLLAIIGVQTNAHGSSAAEVEHRLAGVASAGSAWRPNLVSREQSPASGDRSHPVLYVHGATFPSASSVMFRFEGSSWADSLNDVGFDVFALDFAGYGGSERYPAMSRDTPPVGEPLGRVPEAADQIERAVRFILDQTGASRVSIVAHSWGTMSAGLFATRHPELVDRIVMFGPIVRRDGPAQSESHAWTFVTVPEQHARFTKDVPKDHPPVLIESEFPRWAQTYLNSDPTSAGRTHLSVKTPAGPSADVLAGLGAAHSPMNHPASERQS